MLNKIVKIEDVIKTFLASSVYEIKEEKETPNINFIFNKDFFILLNEIIGNSDIEAYQENITFLCNHSNDDCISIDINNSSLFFNYLTDIINKTIKLYKEYDDIVDSNETIQYLLRRIWLRMGINDIQNINHFLDNQLQFINNRLLDCQEERIIGNYSGYDIYMKTKANDLWDESTRSMVFTLKNSAEEYELPHILYDINNSGICYIYGVQSSQKEKSKHIERKLYQLNKGIDNPLVHPSKVYALLLFINILKDNGIKNIIIPGIQVLSYHYHELLSKEAKKNYEEIKKQYSEHPDDSYLKNRCEYLKNWYLHVYEKQDKISYLKTEELIYLIYRLTEHDSDIEIVNEVNIQDDSLKVKIK